MNANGNDVIDTVTNTNTYMDRDGFRREVRMLRHPPRAFRTVSSATVQTAFRTYNRIRRLIGRPGHDAFLEERASTGLTFAHSFVDARRTLSRRFSARSHRDAWKASVGYMRHLVSKYPVWEARTAYDDALIMALLLTVVFRARWYADLIRDVQTAERETVHGLSVPRFDAMHVSFQLYERYVRVDGDDRRYRESLRANPIRGVTHWFAPRSTRRASPTPTVPSWIRALHERPIPKTVHAKNRIRWNTLEPIDRAVPLKCRHWVAKSDLEGMARVGSPVTCPFCRAPVRASDF